MIHTRKLLAILLLAGISAHCHAQTMTAKPGDAPAKYSRRLPNNYGKIGLSNQQREKIYSIQATYREKIDQLMQELEDLRAEQSLEIQNTLTEPQKAELLRLLEASRKKRAQSKKSN